jgi:Trypsin
MPGLKLCFSLFLVLVTKIHCHRLANRMMNSLATNIKHLPYVVAFYEDRVGVFGTGTILSEKWVLTAAHIWDVE